MLDECGNYIDENSDYSFICISCHTWYYGNTKEEDTCKECKEEDLTI